MKIKYLNILSLFFISALVFMSSCEEEEEWGGTTYTDFDAVALTAPTVTGIIDTAFTLSYNVAEAGALSIYIVPAGSAAPDSVSLYQNATTRIEVAAAGDVAYTFALDSAEINPGESFDVYAIAASTSGNLSTVNKTTVTTTDNRLPVLIDATPSNSTAASKEKDFQIVLTFDGPVTYNAAKPFVMGYYFDGQNVDVPAENVSISGNVVTVTQPYEPIFREYCFITLSEGSLTDAAGNELAEIWSGIAGGYIYGLYWRIRSEIDFSQFTGPYYVASENEIGFGDGESGGYWITVEQFDDYTLQITNLFRDGDVFLATLDPATKGITILNQVIGQHADYGDVFAQSEDPYDVWAASGYKPGSYNEETGALSFFTQIYVGLGSFGFFTYDLAKATPPSGQAYGPIGEIANTVKTYQR